MRATGRPREVLALASRSTAVRLPIAVAQYAGFMARTPVLHVTGLFNAPWRQEGVRATGLLRAVLKAVMRRVNRSSSSELNAQQRACASLIERRVLESGLV